MERGACHGNTAGVRTTGPSADSVSPPPSSHHALLVGCLQTHSLLFTFSSACFDAYFCLPIALALMTSDSADAHIQGITQVAPCQALRSSDSIAVPPLGISASFLGTTGFSFSMPRLFCLDSALNPLRFHFALSLHSLTDAHTTGLYLLMNNLPCAVSAHSPPRVPLGKLAAPSACFIDSSLLY